MISKLGISVAEIAIDGQYSVNENMGYNNGLGSEDLNTFTVCFRFNVKFLRRLPHFISYSTFVHANSLTSYLWLQSDNKLTFHICKYIGLSGITAFCSKKLFQSVKIHDQWHHVCWLFDTEEIDFEEIKVSTKLFFDGNEVTKGDAPLFRIHFSCSIL